METELGWVNRDIRGLAVRLRSVREGVRGRPDPGCDVGKVNANGRSHSRCGALLV
jgi:hypothetical protein